ncbi:MAG: TonB family protein [Myxococcales bacterium]|nr:TonB family protein [Myxococcales bacterium]
MRRAQARALGILLLAGAASGEEALLPPTLEVDSPAAYPRELAGQGLGGEVGLRLLLNERGEVQEAKVSSPVHPLLDSAALEASLRLKFAPAYLGEAPVPVWITFVYRFEAPAQPQWARIAGEVRERGTRVPIAGATVGSQGSEQVSEADGEGRFELKVTPGRWRVWARAPGYEERVAEVEVVPAGRAELALWLERVGRRYETVVRGEGPSLGPSVRLEGEELREVPGTMGDPFRVVMLMPGVGGVASGVAYPVVRGAQPAETGYFIDGVRVPLLFHLFLGPSVLHPDLVESIDFHPAAVPPRFGRILGGVVDARVGRPRQARATAYLDFINAGGLVQAPIERTGTQVSLAGRFSYSPWLLSQLTSRIQANADRKLVLSFYDYQARVEQKLPGGNARLLAFGSQDVASTLRDDDTHTMLFHRVDLRFRPRIGPGEGEVAATVGFDRLQYVEQAGALRSSVLDIDTGSIAGRASYSLPISGALRLALGGDVDHRLARKTRKSYFTEDPSAQQATNVPVATGTFSGGWAELTIAAGSWTLSPGLRADNYHLVGGTNYLALEPRLWVHKGLSESIALELGAGLFHQPPATLLHLPVVDVAGLPEGLQQAAHFNASVEWRLPFAFEVDASAYVNPLLRTIELNPFSGQVLEGFELKGPARRRLAPIASGEGLSHGLAYGAELMVRKHLAERWFGWISYGVQRSERFTSFERYDSYGEIAEVDEASLPYALDQTHLLNAMVSYRLWRSLTLGAAVHFHTGRPETGGLTSQTQRMGFDVFGRPMWLPVDRDRADRLPSFLRIDARVANQWTFDDFRLEAYLDLFNLTLAREVVAYRYGHGSSGLEKVPDGAVVALPVAGIKGTY